MERQNLALQGPSVLNDATGLRTGYHDKRLLVEHFGNAYAITAAYIDQALKSSSIKSKDGKALYSLALFLKSVWQERRPSSHNW